MRTLPLANDVDVAALAQTLAQAAVRFGELSEGMRAQVERLRPTVAFEALQIRLVTASARAAVRRIRKEGVSVPALRGFLHIGALLDLRHFRNALVDLEERLSSPPGESFERPLAPLSVVLDYAGAQVDALSADHLKSLCAFMTRTP